MTSLSSPVSGLNGTRTMVGNEPKAARSTLELQEERLGTFFSGYAWHIDPIDTKLSLGLDELPLTWASSLDKSVCYYSSGSGSVMQRSNTVALQSDIVSTGSMSLANEALLSSASNIEQVLSSIIHERLLSRTVAVVFLSHYGRYLAPQTPVSERIDELILEEQGNEDLLLDRQQQAVWLKQVVAQHWAPPLPQPFIGFDLEDGFFIASWQSDNECNTLTIDAKERIGWYDPWPATEDDNPMPEEVDLEAKETWERLRSALMTIRP